MYLDNLTAENNALKVRVGELGTSLDEVSVARGVAESSAAQLEARLNQLNEQVRLV